MVLILKFWYLQRIYIIFGSWFVDFIFSFRLLNLNKNFWESSIQSNLTICLDLLAASTLVLFIQYTMYSEQNIHEDWIYFIFPRTFCKDKNITTPNMQHILFLHCWIITKNVPLSYSDSVMSLLNVSRK